MDERRYNKLLSIILENNAILKRIEAKIDSEAAKETLSPKEVLEMLGIGKTTYQRYVRAGIITQTKIKGKVHVQRSEIENLIEEGKV